MQKKLHIDSETFITDDLCNEIVIEAYLTTDNHGEVIAEIDQIWDKTAETIRELSDFDMPDQELILAQLDAFAIEDGAEYFADLYENMADSYFDR